MKKIIILGAGITGLSLAQNLRNKADVSILEKEERAGGIAKTKVVEGIAYHMIGGHCFNSKYKEIMDFVFDFLPESEWHKTKRLSVINMGSYEVNYPIEYSVRQIMANSPDLAYQITRDFLSAHDSGNYSDLEDWFRQKFGNTLCDSYFIPYNTKIWGREPKEMDYKWVQDKLPIPDKKSFFKALLDSMSDDMPHSYFYYPNSNNQQTLINALAQGVNIQYSTEVTSIRKVSNRWIINNKYEADILVSTIPLNLLPTYIHGTPSFILKQTELLKYNKVSNVLWESEPTDKTWTYQPVKNSIFHRYIHIGSFFKPAKHYTITECIGEHSYEEMVECGKKDSFLIHPLDYHISEHAYVVFDENRDNALIAINSYLDSIGLYSIGRFGRWEYYNMDICMKDSIETANKIIHEL